MTTVVDDPCGISHRNIPTNQKAVFCNRCNFYIHLKCNDILPSEYKNLENEPDNAAWFCKICTMDMFPSGHLRDDEFLVLLPSPSFELTSGLLDLPNLSDYDINKHMPQSIDSRYFTIPELSSLQVSSNEFTILHTNIRSLSLHYDELVSLSVHTNLNPDVIGVSEIWHSNDNPIISNIDISGYTFLKTKSVTQNGGVGLYIKDSLTFNPRNDLQSCTNEFETVWVEIENTNDKNFLISCVYRHPNSNIEPYSSLPECSFKINIK